LPPPLAGGGRYRDRVYRAGPQSERAERTALPSTPRSTSSSSCAPSRRSPCTVVRLVLLFPPQVEIRTDGLPTGAERISQGRRVTSASSCVPSRARLVPCPSFLFHRRYHRRDERTGALAPSLALGGGRGFRPGDRPAEPHPGPPALLTPARRRAWEVDRPWGRARRRFRAAGGRLGVSHPGQR
jgi:hypothetical protein